MRFSLVDLLFMIVPAIIWFLVTLIIAINEYVSNRFRPAWREATGKLIQIASEIESMSASSGSPWWVIKSNFIYEYQANNQTYREALDSTVSLGQTELPTEEQVKAVNESIEESCPSWRKEIRFWYDPSCPTKLMAHSSASMISKASTEFWSTTLRNIFYTAILAISMIFMVIADKLGCQVN